MMENRRRRRRREISHAHKQTKTERERKNNVSFSVWFLLGFFFSQAAAAIKANSEDYKKDDHRRYKRGDSHACCRRYR